MQILYYLSILLEQDHVDINYYPLKLEGYVIQLIFYNQK